MVSVTIHDNLKYLIIEIFIRDVARKNETIVEGRANRSLYFGLGGERQIEHWMSEWFKTSAGKQRE